VEQSVETPGKGGAPRAQCHQRLVRELLAAQLGIEVAQVDTDCSFRELGLDHDGAVVLTALLRKALGRPLSPTLLFTYRTPARLIASLDRECGAGNAPCVARRVTVRTNVAAAQTFSAAETSGVPDVVAVQIEAQPSMIHIEEE
jgi:acyl carrier protein